MQYALSQEIELVEVEEFEAIAGSGVQRAILDRFLQIGTRRWMQELGIDTQALQPDKERLESLGKTAVLLAVDGKLQVVEAQVADALTTPPLKTPAQPMHSMEDAAGSS